MLGQRCCVEDAGHGQGLSPLSCSSQPGLLPWQGGKHQLDPAPCEFPTQPPPHSRDVWSLSSLLNGLQVSPSASAALPEPWITDSPPICFPLMLALPAEKLAMGMEGSWLTQGDAATLLH